MGRKKADKGKTFHLTFRGTILPKQNAARVKESFAQLFAITDPNTLDEVFSGEVVILRSGLDRAAGGDYYRKIAKLGGNAELVEISKHRTTPGQVLLFLEEDDQGNVTLRRETVPKVGMDEEINIQGDGESMQSWPVSAARLDQDRKKKNTEKRSTKVKKGKGSVHDFPSGKKSVESSKEDTGLTDQIAAEEDAMQAELDRVRQAASEKSLKAAQDKVQAVIRERDTEAANEKAKRDACSMLILDSTREEIERLKGQGKRAEEEAEQELTRIQNMEKDANSTAMDRLETIKRLKVAASEKAHDAICRLRRQELETVELSDRELTKLTEREETIHARVQEAVGRLEQQKSQGDRVSSEQIEKLDTSMQVLDREAQERIESLEQQLEEEKKKREQGLADLAQQKDDLELMRGQSHKQIEKDMGMAREGEREEIEKLQKEIDAAARKKDDDIADYQQLQLGVLEEKKRELKRLADQELEAKQEREDSIEALRKAAEDTRTRAKSERTRLKTQEQEVKRKESKELRRISADVSAEA